MSPAAGMGGELARLASETADAARELMAVNKQAAAWYAARIGWIARSLEARLEERPEPAPELEIRMVSRAGCHPRPGMGARAGPEPPSPGRARPATTSAGWTRTRNAC